MITRKRTPKKEIIEDVVTPRQIDPTLNLYNQENNSEEPIELYSRSRSYFIQFNVSNLYDCFSSGIIVPSVFIENRTIEDIQTKFIDRLLVSAGYIDFFDKTQCLLEISFKPTEIKDYSTQDAFVYTKPIPITRVKRIIVTDQSVKEKVCNTVLTQDVGHIPENIFSFFDNSKYRKIDVNDLNSTNAVIDFKNEIEIFDKLLGLFAFIKNQQLYYADSTNTISNYSEHFLDAFSIINTEIENRSTNYLKPEFLKAYRKLFDFNNTDDTNPSSYIVNYLYKGGLIDNEFIEKFFTLFAGSVSDKKELLFELKNKLINPIGKKSALAPLFEISKYFYQVAYLYIYGKKGSNDKEILKNLVQDELFYSQSEIIFALLGIYYGYKQLRSNETIRFNDPKIERLFGTEFNLKFKLNNKLDYVLIESLYEFVFNKQPGHKNILAYQPLVKEKLTLLKEIKGDSDFELEFDIELFESHFYRIKKQSDVDRISRLLSVFPDKLESHYHLVAFIKKHYDKEFYLLRGSSNIVFKNELLKHLIDGKLRIINYDHFIACIELDKKYNLK